MLFALGAASSAIDLLKSLTSSHASPTLKAGFSEIATSSDSAGSTSTAANSSAPNLTYRLPGSSISPETMSALLAAQSRSSGSGATHSTKLAALKDLFAQLDVNSDGQVSKSEFDTALGAGGTNVAQAHDVFGKLDTNRDGSVSFGELASALHGHGHRHGHKASNLGDTDKDFISKVLDDILKPKAGVNTSDGTTTTHIR
jgi:Ca2+-binding EF-hand superfamily protein